MKKHKKIKCHVMTMYDWLKRNHPDGIREDGMPIFCPEIYGLIYDYKDCECKKINDKGCIACWEHPFRGIGNGKR